MNSNDYISIANAFTRARKQAGDGAESDGVDLAARSVADTLVENNPTLNHASFLNACGVEMVL